MSCCVGSLSFLRSRLLSAAPPSRPTIRGPWRLGTQSCCHPRQCPPQDRVGQSGHEWDPWGRWDAYYGPKAHASP